MKVKVNKITEKEVFLRAIKRVTKSLTIGTYESNDAFFRWDSGIKDILYVYNEDGDSVALFFDENGKLSYFC